MPPNTPKSEIAAIKEEMYTHCKNKEFLITDAIIKLHSIAYSLTTTIKTAAKDAINTPHPTSCTYGVPMFVKSPLTMIKKSDRLFALNSIHAKQTKTNVTAQ